ncbi:MAG: gluconate 2-dehydrogenase subunit 3 family protein [Saprospiraceae bacterium]|nr:gluconate 2-dehydrogenase subunit 3 family protein [Saprospiraceae bacterium]
MDRRETLKTISLLLGYSLTAGTATAFLNGCKASTSDDWKPTTLTEEEVNTLAEICEAILPKTDTPGAKDALCHRYIDEMITHFYTEDKRTYFKKELKKFDQKSKGKYARPFSALNPSEKEAILGILSKEPKQEDNNPENYDPIFKIIKDATVSGYFSSEVGAKGGLCIYDPIPGPYLGCIDYSTVGKTYVY